MSATLPFLSDEQMERIAQLVEKRSPKEKWLDRAVTWGVGILLAWAALQVDVAVLKSRVDTHDELLREIRDDIKTLLRRVP